MVSGPFQPSLGGPAWGAGAYAKTNVPFSQLLPCCGLAFRGFWVRGAVAGRRALTVFPLCSFQVADWTGATYQDKRYTSKCPDSAGGQLSVAGRACPLGLPSSRAESACGQRAATVVFSFGVWDCAWWC